jgi:hypothetical protein
MIKKIYFGPLFDIAEDAFGFCQKDPTVLSIGPFAFWRQMRYNGMVNVHFTDR